MLCNIGGHEVDISSQEHEYYKFLVSQYSLDSFNGLFETDKDGIIVRIAPVKPTPWVILFFVQNIMINQHLETANKKIGILEKRIRDIERNSNI